MPRVWDIWKLHPEGSKGDQAPKGEEREAATHLLQGALASQKLVADGAGDAEHGGKGQGPTNRLPPPRVDIGLVVSQRLVVHHMEQEDALRRKQREEDRERERGRSG